MIQNQETKSLIELAESIACKAHAGQFRRDKVTPYITHPRAVAFRLRMEHPSVIAAALLHDVLEDTTETLFTLCEAGFPSEVVMAVDVLTKVQGTSYEWYLERVRNNPIARKVKVADMLHNLSDSPTENQVIKYAKGLVYLLT